MSLQIQISLKCTKLTLEQKLFFIYFVHNFFFKFNKRSNFVGLREDINFS